MSLDTDSPSFSTPAAVSEPAPAAPAESPARGASAATVKAASGGVPAKVRLESLDALRGFDMLWIAGAQSAVSAGAKCFGDGSGGVVARQMTHAAFGEPGRFYDLIMPLFLFMAGAAMAFSGPWATPGARPDTARWLKVLKRTAVLWVLGMAVQGNLFGYDFANFHWFSNTLQAIAVGGLIAELVAMLPDGKSRVAAFVALPLAYWGLCEWLAPGAYAKDTAAAILVDDEIFGLNRGAREYAWALPSLTFGATVLMGVYAGRFLRGARSAKFKAVALAVAGAACLGLAYAWAPLHPINKHLWTGSFTLWSGGWCLLLLGAFHGVIDGLGWRSWAYPLRVIGANALLAYLLTNLFNLKPFGDVFVRGLRQYVENPNIFGMLREFSALGVLWVILWVCLRHKVFLKF